MRNKPTVKVRLVLSSLLFAFCLPVLAMNLQQAMAELGSVKQQGLVGEQSNGYLGIVKNESNASEIVQQINQARRAEYKKMAATNGISMEEVEALAGNKAMERTLPGNYMQANGKWVKKP
jgi:uncharacterized protein YdbL (DUF1318 family)